MAEKVKRCYIYTRVSTNIQVEGFSLEAQKDRLLKEAKHRNMRVVGEFTYEGKSGKNIAGRTAFREMLDCIKSNQDGVDYVLVFKLSRFGRNAADVINSLQFLQDYGVNLLCVEDGIDSAGAAGKLMISVLSSVAEIERENISAQTMAGRIQKARDGKWNGGFAPYGYKLVDGKLEIEEAEAKIVRIIFEQFIKGRGLNGVANWMNEQGYKKKTRQNGTIDYFTYPFIKGVIDNPVYNGKIAYGRRRNEKIKGARNEYHVVKQDEYEVYDGIHEAIIDDDTWELAQQKRKQHAIKYEKVYSMEHEHILSGILRCPVCDAPMYGSVNRKKSKRTGEVKDTFYYVCKHRRIADGIKCNFSKQPSQNQINSEVEAMIISASKDPEFIKSIKNDVSNKTDIEEIRKILSELKAKKEKVLVVKQKLVEQQDKLDITDRCYDAKFDDLNERINQKYDELAEIEKQIERTQNDLNKCFEAEQTVNTAIVAMDAVGNGMYDALQDTFKKNFFRNLLERVEIFPEKTEDGRYVKSIQFKFPVVIKNKTGDGIRWDNDNHVETILALRRTNM